MSGFFYFFNRLKNFLRIFMYLFNNFNIIRTRLFAIRTHWPRTVRDEVALLLAAVAGGLAYSPTALPCTASSSPTLFSTSPTYWRLGEARISGPRVAATAGVFSYADGFDTAAMTHRMREPATSVHSGTPRNRTGVWRSGVRILAISPTTLRIFPASKVALSAPPPPGGCRLPAFPPLSARWFRAPPRMTYWGSTPRLCHSCVTLESGMGVAVLLHEFKEARGYCLPRDLWIHIQISWSERWPDSREIFQTNSNLVFPLLRAN